MKKMLLFLVATTFFSFAVASQTPTTPVSQGTSEEKFTLKTGTEVVLVNVTVRDKSGMYIKNLKADDFTVLEDGKKQTINSIDAENTDSVVTAEAPKTPVLRNLSATPATASSAAASAAPLQENDLKDR